MLLLNFAHPLTGGQRARLEELLGRSVERVVEIRTQFDHALPFAEQARALVEGLGLTNDQWQMTPLLVNPPSFSPIACLVLAELYGCMGYFPAVLRLRPVPGTTPPAFEVAEVLNLQAAREQARLNRY